MYTKLAMLAMLASETTVDEARAWQTKTATENWEGLDQAFLTGFYEKFMPKTAYATESYIHGSEIGKELGLNILYNMKRGV